jgi:putative acetyltransferase
MTVKMHRIGFDRSHARWGADASVGRVQATEAPRWQLLAPAGVSRCDAEMVRIRGYKARDAGALSDLFRRSVEQIGPKDYAEEQVRAWAGLGPCPAQIEARANDGRTTLVAVDERDRPLAFGDLEHDGHIAYLYCAPEAAGQGVTAVLYDQLEQIARERRMKRLHVEASEAARRFFLKKGFAVAGKRTFEIGAVPIHNYAMEKRL